MKALVTYPLFIANNDFWSLIERVTSLTLWLWRVEVKIEEERGPKKNETKKKNNNKTTESSACKWL